MFKSNCWECGTEVEVFHDPEEWHIDFVYCKPCRELYRLKKTGNRWRRDFESLQTQKSGSVS